MRRFGSQTRPRTTTSPRAPEFNGQKDQILSILGQRHLEKDSRSWKAIAKRLWRMHKAGVFSANDTDLIDPSSLMEPGRISLIDLSDMDAPYLRNLVIAQVLRMLQARQDEVYREREAAVRRGRQVGPALRLNIFIEEAHEFLSSERIKQMPNLFDQVARIARRGRKRYLGLAFVTQLPGHLPDEVFGLVNNWIIHKLTDTNVIDRLRKVVPMVGEATWKSLPNLAPGQSLCSFSHLTRPVSGGHRSESLQASDGGLNASPSPAAAGCYPISSSVVVLDTARVVNDEAYSIPSAGSPTAQTVSDNHEWCLQRRLSKGICPRLAQGRTVAERRPLQLLDGPARPPGKKCDVSDRGYRDFPEARLYACRIAPDGEDSVPATFYRVVCPFIAQRFCSIEVEAPAPQLGLEPAAVGVVLRQVPVVQSKVPGLEVGAENIVGPRQKFEAHRAGA